MTNLSTKISSNVQVHTGNYKTIGQKLTPESGEQPRWIVVKGTTGQVVDLTVELAYIQDTDARMFKALDILVHAANGDFNGWTLVEHQPRYEVVVEDASLGVFANRSATRGVEKLELVNDSWQQHRAGMALVSAPPAQQFYHTAVNAVIQGHSLAIALPAYYASAYAWSIHETISAGKGKAWDMATEKKLMAKEARVLYRAARALSDAGLEFGEEDEDSPIANLNGKKADPTILWLDGGKATRRPVSEVGSGDFILYQKIGGVYTLSTSMSFDAQDPLQVNAVLDTCGGSAPKFALGQIS
jgi:hypothetical protein